MCELISHTVVAFTEYLIEILVSVQDLIRCSEIPDPNTIQLVYTTGSS